MRRIAQQSNCSTVLYRSAVAAAAIAAAAPARDGAGKWPIQLVLLEVHAFDDAACGGRACCQPGPRLAWGFQTPRRAVTPVASGPGEQCPAWCTRGTVSLTVARFANKGVMTSLAGAAAW